MTEIEAHLAELSLLPQPVTGPHPAVVRSDPETLRDRWRGALVGGAVGDALGRPAERLAPSAVREHFGELRDFVAWYGWRSGPTGTWTDDTQLTICVAESILAGGGRVDPTDLAERLVRWLPHGRGVGRTCRDAVERLDAGEPWWQAGRPSAGNGAAMRAAPVGLAHPYDLLRLRVDAAASAAVTHADATAVASTVAQAFAVAYCAHQEPGTLDPAAFLDAVLGVLVGVPDPPVKIRGGARAGERVTLGRRIAEVTTLLDADPTEAFGYLHNGAFVLESLPAALWCFLTRCEDPEAVIVTAVAGGRDADTVAAMAGSLAGAYHGESALPSRWVDDLEGLDELRALADGLLAVAQNAGT